MEKVITHINFNEPNNGRTYNKESLKNAIDHYINDINAGKIKFGTIADTTNYNEYLDLGSATHKINKVSYNNGEVDVDLEILDTPKGQIVNQMLKNNYKIEIIPRIIQEESKENDIKIKDIISWDLITKI